jgi:hypothetical protein
MLTSMDATIRLWDVKTRRYLQMLRSDRPQVGMNISVVTGITEAQKAMLKMLGAVDRLQ